MKPEGRGGLKGQRAIASLNLEAPEGALSSCAITSRGGWGHGHGGVPSHRVALHFRWHLSNPIPGTERWPDDEGAWELRDY